jgi:rare lipoprotein A
MFNPAAFTAAHRTLPMGSRVIVTNVRTGKSVSVRINDRGPYVAGRVIDLSRSAAQAIGLSSQGVAAVRIQRVSKR